MPTTTYSAILQLAARLAGRPPDKLPTSEAQLLRDFIGDHLAVVHVREAWPESCRDFRSATLTDGAFAIVTADEGDLLSLYAAGNPQTTTVCTRLDDWSEGDDVIRVTGPSDLTGTLYAEFQTPVPTLPDYGDTDLDATALAGRYKFPLARLAAADLLENRDPAKALKLRAAAEVELLRQASRIKTPWWRR